MDFQPPSTWGAVIPNWIDGATSICFLQQVRALIRSCYRGAERKRLLALCESKHRELTKFPTAPPKIIHPFPHPTNHQHTP